MMTKRIFPVMALLALAGLTLAQNKPQTSAQNAPADDLDTIRVDVNLVNLFFSARDKNGAYLTDLKQSDFTVWEDGKQQDIRAFSRESNLPLTIGLLIDVSRSQETLIGDERRAGSQFFRTVLHDKDLAFLISFGADVELLQDFTGSARLLEKGLGELRLSAGFSGGAIPTSNPKGTLLFDSVYLAAHDQLNGQVGRKVLVLITDGADQGSTYKVKEAIEAAHRADAIIYSIYYADRRMYDGFMPSSADLRRMSEDTGGRLFEVSRRMPLDKVFDAIQEEMRSQYTLAYGSSNPAKDGAFRKIEIRPANKNTRVQARKGYFAEAGKSK